MKKIIALLLSLVVMTVVFIYTSSTCNASQCMHERLKTVWVGDINNRRPEQCMNCGHFIIEKGQKGAIVFESSEYFGKMYWHMGNSINANIISITDSSYGFQISSYTSNYINAEILGKEIGDVTIIVVDETYRAIGKCNVSVVEHKHTYISQIITEPTCTTVGTNKFTCTCGDSYTKTIYAINHANATTDAGKAPTTTEVGYTAGKYCPDCEIWLEGHEEIPKLHSHVYNSSTVMKEPTCTEEGIKKYICDCGFSYTTTLSKANHFYKLIGTNPSTCFKEGTKIFVCVCGDTITEPIPALGHDMQIKLEKSTLTKGGMLNQVCKNCNAIKNVEIYPLVNGFILSDYEYTYNGKVKTPTVTVKDETGLILVENKDYTVKYENGRKNPGKYTVTVTLIGNYEGEKKLEFSILPGKTTSVSATQSTDSIKLTWKKVTGADGYRVYQYNSKTGKYEKIKTLTGTSYTVKKLKAGTTYKFAVKAYSKADGETLWAASSVSFKTATKPATPTVKATASSDKVTLKWSKVAGATGYVVYMQDEFGDYEKIGTTKNTSYTRKKLTKGETYYFRVRAYKTVDSKNIYGGYKTVKVKVK